MSEPPAPPAVPVVAPPAAAPVPGTQPPSPWRRWRSDSLLARIVVVLVAGVVAAQLLGTLLWARQLRESARQEALGAAAQLARGAAGTIRFFRDLPPPFRPILIEQLRTMGGTRFFVNVNKAPVPVQAVQGNALADTVVQAVHAGLAQELGRSPPSTQVAFAWPQTLQVADDGTRVPELPDAWVQATLLLRPRPAPVLVVQAEFEPGRWLLLAATMPDPYFLDNANPLTWDRVALQLVTLATVLLLSVLLVRGLIRPLNRLAAAARAFGSADTVPEPLPETGTAELRRTARAFNDMQARIQGYLLDRERLFVGISHGLKTPIMRLKLRTELLDDETLRAEFHEDLDDLDIMVKSALQSVRDSDIHENRTPVALDTLLARLAQRPIHPDARVDCHLQPLRVQGKPLALERAFRNLLDNISSTLPARKSLIPLETGIKVQTTKRVWRGLTGSEGSTPGLQTATSGQA